MTALLQKLGLWPAGETRADSQSAERPNAHPNDLNDAQIQRMREIADEERRAWVAHKSES